MLLRVHILLACRVPLEINDHPSTHLWRSVLRLPVRQETLAIWVPRTWVLLQHAERMATPRPRVGQPAWVAEPSLADGAVYALGQVTDQKGEACEVQLTGAAEPIQVPATSCWPVNEPGSHALHDLTELHFVHEAALLAHVSERYSGGSIYTYVGPTLVSLNPFRELPGVYGEEAC